MRKHILKSAMLGKIHNSHSLVVNTLGKAIVNGTYGSGSLLPGDAELAERFEVSRTVLREAMKTLTAKGMIVAKTRIGTRVTDRKHWNFFDADILSWHLERGVDDTFLDHLSEMRLSLEPFAAKLAAKRATNEDLDQLYACAEAMRAARTIDEFAVADLGFHMVLLGASKNPFMYSVGGLIEAALVISFRLSSPVRQPELQEASAVLHRRIAEMVESGDPIAAAKAVEAVIHEGRERARTGDVGK